MNNKIQKTEAEWREQLSDEEFRVARQAGTEPAYTGEYTDTKTPGSYACVCCGAELFRSTEKFDSSCGWPSFVDPASTDAVTEHSDVSHGMRRIEIRCAQCEAHLGHVFPDGPGPGGLRYCINSVVLKLKPDSEE